MFELQKRLKLSYRGSISWVAFGKLPPEIALLVPLPCFGFVNNSVVTHCSWHLLKPYNCIVRICKIGQKLLVIALN